MKFWEDLPINAQEHLLFGGCDTVELAKEYGTPLYVMNEQVIREACRSFMRVFKEQKLDGQVYFASKAFSCLAIYQIVMQEGLGADVVSGGELYTALKAGMPAERIVFHGNNKSMAEIEMAVENGVGRIVIDNFEEIDRVARICAQSGKETKVLLRVKPGIDAHTHNAMLTGANDSKFGLGVFDGQAMLAVEKILSCSQIFLEGIHAHIGSQIFELTPFEKEVDVLTDFVAQIKEKFAFEINEINFGGGYGISYVQNDKPLEPHEYVEVIAKTMKIACKAKGLNQVRFAIEPGRSIVGEAGITLYTIGSVKKIPQGRTYVAVDGGMADNPRFALYQAEYTACLANKAKAPNNQIVTLAGKCCESGDILIEDMNFPDCESGDIVSVFSTGAYNYSMASNYNRLPKPPVVLVDNGNSELIVKRQSYEQLVENDLPLNNSK